jgi:hypothetical protein
MTLVYILQYLKEKTGIIAVFSLLNRFMLSCKCHLAIVSEARVQSHAPICKNCYPGNIIRLV